MADAREMLDDYEWRGGSGRPKAFEALRAVLELHRPRDYGASIGLKYDGRYQCDHCADNCHSHSGLGCEEPFDAEWPCPTVRAISKALEGS